MKITVSSNANIYGGHQTGLVSIWWYTDDGQFWNFSKTMDSADEHYGYLQYSETQNHMTLWRQAVKDHIKDKSEQDAIIAKGFKSFERGRIVYNIRSQCFEITCSSALFTDRSFRNSCIDYFGLKGNRYEFVKLDHYSKQELTGNPAIDEFYYDSQF